MSLAKRRGMVDREHLALASRHAVDGPRRRTPPLADDWPVARPFSGCRQLFAERQTYFRKVIPLHLSETLRYAPAQIIAAEGQHFQIGQFAQLRRYLPGQLIAE